jgi:hypothetical protein
VDGGPVCRRHRHRFARGQAPGGSGISSVGLTALRFAQNTSRPPPFGPKTPRTGPIPSPGAGARKWGKSRFHRADTGRNDSDKKFGSI